jgi:hypothetical protein
MNAITKPSTSREVPLPPVPGHPAPESFDDFEVYRSGAYFNLRCKDCTQSWPFARTDLSVVLGAAREHRCQS